MYTNAYGITSNHSGRWRTRLLAAGAAIAAALTACGGGSEAMSGANGGGAASGCVSNCGAALLTLQDAAGDFLSYTVDVVSIKLQKANGAVVETLPATTRVDFAQLVDLSELVSAGQIPAGDYVAATLTVDYSNASISADDGIGGSVALAPLDASGNPLSGPVELTVQLDNRHHLVITPGRSARLAFDFNLAVSNTVNLGTATVSVAPLIQASVVPPADLKVRVRGTLASVDTANSTYDVQVRPFHLGSGDAGAVTVHTSRSTNFEIDGTSYQGAAGLAALANETSGTVAVAFGTLQTADLSFTANRVLAGSSVESSKTDRVRGNVIARSGDTLTVRGATLDRRDGGFEYLRGNVTVKVADTTRVTEEGQTGNFGSGDISVGQRIWATGTVTIDTATGNATLDATAGHARLEITPLWGLVGAAVANPLTLQLLAIDGRDATIYNFAGTGASPASDANAAAYAVDTGTLDLGSLSRNAPARLFGFPLPFGTATSTDFRALSVVSYAQVANQLALGWTGGSLTAFPGLSAGSTALDLDRNGAGLAHFMQIGPQRIDLLALAAAPPIVPDLTAAATGFAIGHGHSRSIENFQAFADFITALNSAMNGTTKALGIAANGHYDGTTNRFAADHVAVLLND
jgi:hypothetical protein